MYPPVNSAHREKALHNDILCQDLYVIDIVLRGQLVVGRGILNPPISQLAAIIDSTQFAKFD